MKKSQFARQFQALVSFSKPQKIWILFALSCCCASEIKRGFQLIVSTRLSKGVRPLKLLSLCRRVGRFMIITPSSHHHPNFLIAFSCLACFRKGKLTGLLTGGGSDDAEYSLAAYSAGLTTMESASFSIFASIVNPDMSRVIRKRDKTSLFQLFFPLFITFHFSYQHNGNLFLFLLACATTFLHFSAAKLEFLKDMEKIENWLWLRMGENVCAADRKISKKKWKISL